MFQYSGTERSTALGLFDEKGVAYPLPFLKSEIVETFWKKEKMFCPAPDFSYLCTQKKEKEIC